MRNFIWGLLLCSLAVCGCRNPDNGPVGPVSPDGLVFVVVDDAAGRTPENSKVITDLSQWQALTEAGHLYRLVDRPNPEAKNFLTPELEKQLPALVVKNRGNGKTLFAGRVPNTVQDLEKLVDRLGVKVARGPPLGAYKDKSGVYRGLGLKAKTPESIRQRQRMLSFKGQLQGAALIPRDKWRDVDSPLLRAGRFVLNQRSSSACVGYSAAMAVMKTRFIRGHIFERLSGMIVYAPINGGQDSGAYIHDAAETLAKNGICLESEFDYPKRYWREVPDSAKESARKRLSLSSYTIETEEELATALQLGLIVQAGVQVDGAFENFDKNGVSYANGQNANHSIHIYGMKLIDGKWRYLMGNSWGEEWGPWGDGSCYLNANGLVIAGTAFVHVDQTWQPGEILPDNKRKLPNEIFGVDYAGVFGFDGVQGTGIIAGGATPLSGAEQFPRIAGFAGVDSGCEFLPFRSESGAGSRWRKAG